MYSKTYNRCETMRFRRFSRKSYALFACLGKVVLIGTLSAPIVAHAKAEGISTKTATEDNTHTGIAGEYQLDEVNITGSRAPMAAIQSAKIVAVITKDDINRAAAESINDVLKLATGVDVRQRGGFGVQTDISIDGGTFDQIAIFLNGVNISNPQTGHNAADFPIDIKDIERVEVLRGASARVFGAQAFSGAVNIITRPSHDNNARISAQAGSYGTFGTSAAINLQKGAVRNRISGGYMRTDGGTDNSDFQKRHGFYQGIFNSRHLDLQWQAGMTSQKYGANTFYSGKYKNQFEETCRYLTSLTGDIKLLRDDALHISPSLYYNHNYDHYQLIRYMEGAKAGENYHQNNIYGGGINSYISWTLGKTAFGYEVRREEILSTALGIPLDSADYKHIGSTNRYYDKKAHRTNTSFYLEHDIILDNFTLSAGVLANKNTGLSGGLKFYPGIDISFRPTDNWKLYASWNKSLRMPSFTDMYMVNVIQQGDSKLKPERNSVYNVGVQYGIQGIEVTASGFYSQGRDMIDWVFSTQQSTKYQSMNIGKLDNKGVSVDLYIDMPKLINDSRFPITYVKMGYAYINQKHETTQPIYKSLYALEYLKHKFTAELNHRIWNKLSATWSMRWQQRMNGYHPYTKIDGKIKWTAEKYDLFVQADNITNHHYYDLTAVEQPGIWIMAGANIRLNL